MAINVMGNTDGYEKMPYPIIVDSGAAESVMPIDWCPQAQTVRRKKEDFTAANGSPIENKGEKIVTMVTREGQWKNIRFQMCNVTRPLASVHSMCEAGHTVVFNSSWGPRGSYILNNVTKEKMWMKPKDGTYILETKVAPQRFQYKPSQGFGGPGR